MLQTALLLMILLQVKHLFADFFLQTPRMLSGRGVYLHLGRAEHAVLHAILSFLALMLFGASTACAATLCLLEWIIHYHIDWAKGRHSEIKKYSPADAGYWRAFGVDQLMHQITYVAMIWAWAKYVA
ncbi:DUF3307 domain-containing protein [Sulfitobacter sp. F26204]|uniref:DUF3307 domain-containing protein n=1 Tax=Sulfitobacter sp. F26204 TaxID=2996014 RepID=UPI002B1FFC19|nr:DUF3307 domain-containing protein [Sulfitobacter sp. F26204]